MSSEQIFAPHSLADQKRYEPAEVESRVIARWLDNAIFRSQATGEASENYSIAIPPPNVTGTLHMGHALNGTIQDTLTRLARMRGKRTKWALGTDHAGIATQTKVEQQLKTEGTSREQIGRDAFTQRTWEWRNEYGGQIVEQYKRLGASCDYSQERFTMDSDYEQAVLKVFVELYEQGLIYRDHYIVNWDPGSQSAISDLEVENREGVRDTLYEIAYPLADGSGEIVVATVRPETIPADVAIAVHPEDERYKQLVGKEAILPLSDGKRIPIIADDYIELGFGTGCLKVTPAHDVNDFEIGRRHNLPAPLGIDESGCLTEIAGEAFAGMPADKARSAIVAELQTQGLIRGEEEYVHTVPFSHRSGARIEPLVSLQWFMRMDELAKPAMAAVAEGRIRIHPESQSRRYLAWLEEIRPWCISRQLWWGHRIPVWYRGEETYVGVKAPTGEGWQQDSDVLDTWFSSALWPFAVFGWPKNTPEFQAFYPTDVLVTSRDILFLWVARMVMMGLRFTGKDPFRDVYVHSIIQAPDGRRMSKSLGTGIDPLQEIDSYGADAVRFGLLAMSSTQDVRYSPEKLKQGSQLANKLFNATRFVLLSVDEGTAPAAQPKTVEDRWILTRLEHFKGLYLQHLDSFDFAKAALALYDFVYSELCDWYLEFVKPRLHADADSDDRAALSATLLYVIRETLALAHPIIPFVTEELWSHLTSDTENLLATSLLPSAKPDLQDKRAQEQIVKTIAAIQAVRGWRASAGIAPGAHIPARLRTTENYTETTELIARLARLSWVETATGSSFSIPVQGGQIELFPAADIDLTELEQRLVTRRKKVEHEIQRTKGKLGNNKFLANAPAAIVAGEKAKLAELSAELETLTTSSS